MTAEPRESTPPKDENGNEPHSANRDGEAVEPDDAKHAGPDQIHDDVDKVS